MASSFLNSDEHVSTRNKIATILALAIPAVLENLLQTAVGFVDTLFVSQLGIEAVIAVGLSNTLIVVYIAIFMALGVGASSLIARSVGAGDLAKAKAVAKQSTWVAILTGGLFGAVSLFFAEPLLLMMGATPDVLADASLYFRIVATSSVFIALMIVFGSILRSIGDTKTPLKVAAWINVLHIALDYLLIFGLWKFAGFGIAGAAWATVIVRAVGIVFLYRSVQKSEVSFSLFAGLAPSENKGLIELLALSTPTAIERLVMRVGQVLYFALIVRIGKETFAAHTIAGNIEQFAYMPGYGFAVAATTLVGQSIGANREKDAYSYGLLTACIGVVVMSVLGVVFLFLLSPWFASWFTTDEEVSEMVVTALRIDAFAQPFLAVSLILAGALQGMGDTKSPMYSTVVGMWIIRIAGVYVMSILFDLGIAGVWLSIAIDLLVRAIFLFYRFRQRLSAGNHIMQKKSLFP